VEGLSDRALEATFVAAREADYEALAAEARALQSGLGARGKRAAEARAQAEGALVRLRRKLEGIHRIDFFPTPGRQAAERLIHSIETGLRPPAATEAGTGAHARVRGRTWVTRAGVQIDRIASAWLIRSFIDPEARFRFVRGDEAIAPGELRFDMFEGEYGHEGERCTFETLLARFALDEPALRRVGEVVHDLDCKEARFGHAEAAGVAAMVQGIAAAHERDEDRLQSGLPLFEALYQSFRAAG